MFIELHQEGIENLNIHELDRLISLNFDKEEIVAFFKDPELTSYEILLKTLNESNSRWIETSEESSLKKISELKKKQLRWLDSDFELFTKMKK